MKTKIRKSRPGGTILLPGTLVSIVSFRQVGHGVGQTVDPHFDPHEKVQIRNKKHPKSDDFRCFLYKENHSLSEWFKKAYGDE